jgi:predicted MPP superfamily phosphohydrolase
VLRFFLSCGEAIVLFVLTFLSIYSAMHALVFWGIHPLLKGHPALPTLTWIWMGCMILAPILVRTLDRAGWETAARGLAWVGYSWMGIVLLAFAAFAVLGCWDLLMLLFGRIFSGFSSLSLHGAVTSCLVIFGVLAAALYGFHAASNLRVERVRISSSKLPPGLNKLTVAQVSDLHLGLILREAALAPVISRLRELHPDLVVATGDIVDAQINHLNGLSALWRDLDPPLGKWAVTGNHEYHAGLKQSLDFLQQSGFTVLRNRAQTIGGWLTLAGIDDPMGGHQDETALLRPLDRKNLILFLKHRPEFDQGSAGLFDLQLSGHAHGGQIFPFTLLTGLRYPLQHGLHNLAGGGLLYTSRGTGTWGPPMRIGAPPEITLFEIIPAGQ